MKQVDYTKHPKFQDTYNLVVDVIVKKFGEDKRKEASKLETRFIEDLSADSLDVAELIMVL